MANTPEIQFSFLHKEIEWEINNFTTDLLKNSSFSQIQTEPFFITLENPYVSTKWILKLERFKTYIVCYLLIPSAVVASRKLLINFEVGLLNRYGRIFNNIKAPFDGAFYPQRLGKLGNYRLLKANENDLMKNKTLTIVLKLDILQRASEPIPAKMSEQYEKLFNNEKYSDFTLVLSDDREIPVHKNILSIRSSVFETMMETSMRERNESKCTIIDIDSRAMLEFLRFVYCERVENIDEVAADLLYAATKYHVPDLKPLCADSLAAKLSNENAIETLMLADLHGAQELKSICIDFILRNYDEMRFLEGWNDIPQSLYKDILTRSVFSMKNQPISLYSKIEMVNPEP